MGSLVVLSPADTRPEHFESDMIHPFFTESRTAPPRNAQTASDIELSNSADVSICSFDGTSDETLDAREGDPNGENGRQRKRRKFGEESDEEQATDKKPRRSKKAVRTSLGGNIAEHFKRIEVPVRLPAPVGPPSPLPTSHATLEPNSKASPPVADPTPAFDDKSHDCQGNGESNGEGIGETAKDDHQEGKEKHTPEAKVEEDKPKKMLRLNFHTGTIGSPPKPKQRTSAMELANPPVRRGRPRKTMIVTIKYGKDAASQSRIGEAITKILESPRPVINLSGGRTNHLTSRLQRSGDNTPENQTKTTRETHPFFLGKAKPAVAANAQEMAAEGSSTRQNQRAHSPSRQRLFTSTPCSPKKSRIPSSNTLAPAFGVRHFGVKVPGAQPPAWPWKDMVHVRGTDTTFSRTPEQGQTRLPFRKSKGNSVNVPAPDSILTHLSRCIDVASLVEEVRHANSDDFLPPPKELRLPQKHFESGHRLMERVHGELRCIPAKISSSEQLDGFGVLSSFRELLPWTERGEAAPPQLRHLYTLAYRTLSAFDQSQCETTCWTQKYAPLCAAEIIQPGREVMLLKQWLQGLMVQSVDTGASDGQRLKLVSKAKTTNGKQSRKRKKLDGFIVSSDEEDNEMDELSDGESTYSPDSNQPLGKRTVVRAGDRAGKGLREGSRLTNTVVISGPTGCGKTAAVYAIAKELDFEVFEINPGSRRSGKDVLEKIGDMTRNHLVQQTGVSSTMEDSNNVRTEDAKSIQTGRQGTMNLFFKATSQPKPAKKSQPGAPLAAAEPQKSTTKQQKQSLILLDEADILYEEDKQFWSTVLAIIAQSKRPLIITCNDEALVPLQTLQLHAIFRFSPPQTELAVDRLLLIAACEGHALRRKAVEALYDMRRGDLRATLTDLNFWCQLGVGDRRGGFDWFVLRWPRGIDRDQGGHVVRVVSEGTFEAGMGCLNRDGLFGNPVRETDTTEQDILQHAWESWRMDIGDWQDSLALDAWATAQGESMRTRQQRLDAVQAYADFVDTLSFADLCSFGQLSTDTEDEVLDPTLPELSQKMCDDHIAGLPLLNAATWQPCDGLGLSVPLSLKSLARKSLQARSGALMGRHSSELDPLNEETTHRILQQRRAKPNRPNSFVTRTDFNAAFNPLATGDSSGLLPVPHSETSLFTDRPLTSIALDVAPYVRGIVAYDAQLAQSRLRLSNLLSEGGRGPKRRMRTTRSAFSAMEGGERSSTRGDRWFKAADLNAALVMHTGGGVSWREAVLAAVEAQRTALGVQAEYVGQETVPRGCEGDDDEAGEQDSPPAATRPHRAKGRRAILSESEDELAAEGSCDDNATLSAEHET